jgi:hypothetical protein
MDISYVRKGDESEIRYLKDTNADVVIVGIASPAVAWAAELLRIVRGTRRRPPKRESWAVLDASRADGPVTHEAEPGPGDGRVAGASV